jgi:type VI secretion system secreted protein Hcp
MHAMTFKGLILLSVLGLGLAVTCPIPAQAEQIYVTIQGAKQGAFKGESIRKGTETKIEAIKFSYEVVSPRDAATGQPTGKRQHKPIILVKPSGAASPQLFNALVNNEMLPKVQIDFVGVVPTGAGQDQLLRTITISNAFVTDFKQFTDGTQPQMRTYDEVSFIFQRIEINDTVGKTAAMDDWNSPK